MLGVGATNKPSEDDRSSLQQPDFNGEQSAASKGDLTKVLAGWMMMGPIQTGPVSPAGRTIVIIITHNWEELFSSFTWISQVILIRSGKTKRQWCFQRHTREEKRRNIPF